MATYKWSRYNISYGTNPPFSQHVGQWISFVNLHKAISWDGSSWQLSGGMFASNDYISSGTEGYMLTAGILTKFIAGSNPNYATNLVDTISFRADPSQRESVRGSYVSDVTSTSRSAYPDNGISGSYWYVFQGEVVNTAPTTPGPFTQPIGILEIGDRKTISWGASTDSESNLANYILEVSINNGAWAQMGTPTTNNFTYTIPTATSIRFRVKARDTGGLETAYRESAMFTVQPPQYYWSKYNVVTHTSYSVSWIAQGGSAGSDGYPGYGIDGNGDFYTTGVYESYDYYQRPVGKTLYKIFDKHQIVRYHFTSSQETVNSIGTAVPTTTQVRGSLIQSGIIAGEGAYPINGQQSGYWWVRGSRVNESIAPPQGITSPEADTVFRPGNTVSIAFTASTAANISAYEVDYRYNNDTWTPLATNATLTRSLTAPTDSTKTTLEFRIRAKNASNVYSDYIYSPLYLIQHNVAPVVTLNTENNKILYENDSFEIPGTVQDVDNGNTVTVRYQISGDAERAIKAYLSNGSQELYSKTLTFKGGKLYDGETVIVSDLVDGTPYTLRVWATDDKGGTSAIAERTFYVVPNRVPTLIVNSPIIQGTIENDKFTVDGEFTDPDNNTAIVTYRINGGNSVQVAEGTSGTFDFEVSFGQLKIGENVIIVEAVDSYGAKVTKSIKLNKSVVETALLKSTARYKIDPPKGNAKAVLLWIQRAEALAIDVSISMQMVEEAESYEVLTPTNTAPITSVAQIVEDEFYYEATSPKDNIILQIDMTRNSVEVNDAILLISGVLE